MRKRGLCMLAVASAALAQQGLYPRPSGTQSSNGAASASTDPTSSVRRAANLSSFPDTSGRPGFISGRVMISGGSGPPGDSIAIVRICGGVTTREGFTDLKGRFAFQLGASQLVPDASLTSARAGNASNGGSESSRGCELRADLPGYRSDSVSLERHSVDNGQIGTLFLHPLIGRRGLTISATTGLAPQPARKAYEKGMAAIHQNLPDEAQRNFSQAVELFPRFAASWFELGRVFERRDHFDQAWEAYRKAIAADDRYPEPYEHLYGLALKEEKWQEAADASDKVLRLNPYDFPSAYYANAMAHFHLHDLEIAERRAREATQLEGAQFEPAANYVLGSILAEKGDLTGSAEALKIFLSSSIATADRARAEKLLADVRRRARAAAVAPNELPQK